MLLCSDLPYHERVDIALEWLGGSEGVIPDLVTLYFSNVDSMGHEGGQDSLLVSGNPATTTQPLTYSAVCLQVDEALEFIDSYMKRLMDGLYRQNLHRFKISDTGLFSFNCKWSSLAGAST